MLDAVRCCSMSVMSREAVRNEYFHLLFMLAVGAIKSLIESSITFYPEPTTSNNQQLELSLFRSTEP